MFRDDIEQTLGSLDSRPIDFFRITSLKLPSWKGIERVAVRINVVFTLFTNITQEVHLEVGRG